ncbi:hypothetical protein GCM10014715_65620 [Streptomyces spiralis]|uniref:Uncharacterized protein n=1 Tax=Streptomyces spiralis TaxID=66376 RepID=A0A919AE29_9ACTN|nr:hypothetical protein GCM10014715_65620 [Streptomyces spiralis]
MRGDDGLGLCGRGVVQAGAQEAEPCQGRFGPDPVRLGRRFGSTRKRRPGTALTVAGQCESAGTGESR